MLGYNQTAGRFVNRATGRFVSRSRGLSSSVARQEQSAAQTRVIRPEKDTGFEVMPYEALERAIEPRHAKVDIDIKPGAMADFLDSWANRFVEDDDLDLDQEDHYSLED